MLMLRLCKTVIVLLKILEKYTYIEFISFITYAFCLKSIYFSQITSKFLGSNPLPTVGNSGVWYFIVGISLPGEMVLNS